MKECHAASTARWIVSVDFRKANGPTCQLGMCTLRDQHVFFAAWRDNGPLAKKPSNWPDGDATRHSRKVIKAIFRRYNLLSRAEEEGKHLAFDALLDACEGEQ